MTPVASTYMHSPARAQRFSTNVAVVVEEAGERCHSVVDKALSPGLYIWRIDSHCRASRGRYTVTKRPVAVPGRVGGKLFDVPALRAHTGPAELAGRIDAGAGRRCRIFKRRADESRVGYARVAQIFG
jgi:hypothetical protein